MADEQRAVRTVETGEHKDRILIVEDEDNARKGYEQLLQRWGYEVLGVATAEDALAKFSNFQPDHQFRSWAEYQIIAAAHALYKHSWVHSIQGLRHRLLFDGIHPGQHKD